MYNVELLFNRHVTDIMIIILLHFLLSIYLWLHCEFRALVIRIYMYIVAIVVVYTCTLSTLYMYMYNVELLFNRHVTDIMIIILLHFLLSIYLWLHCEFRALVIRIYMYIVYTCTYVHCYLHVPSCPQCVLCQLAIIGRCGLYTSNSPSPSSYLCLHTVFCSHHPLSWPLMYM